MSILQTTLVGSGMILTVMLLRTLLLYRLPRKTFLALWMAAAVRLLLPWAIPSVLSAYTLLEPQPQAAPEVSVTAAMPTAAPAGTTAAVPQQTVSVWLWIWLGGAGLTAVYFAVSYVRWRRRFAESLPLPDEAVQDWVRAHPLHRRLSVRQSGFIAAPLTYGLFQPVILLPNT